MTGLFRLQEVIKPDDRDDRVRDPKSGLERVQHRSKEAEIFERDVAPSMNWPFNSQNVSKMPGCSFPHSTSKILTFLEEEKGNIHCTANI